MEDKVVVLRAYQVWDPGRGGFFVGLEATKQRHQGHTVYKDAFGRRIVILEEAL